MARGAISKLICPENTFRVKHYTKYTTHDVVSKKNKTQWIA
jgi:hypothetical protein